MEPKAPPPPSDLPAEGAPAAAPGIAAQLSNLLKAPAAARLAGVAQLAQQAQADPAVRQVLAALAGRPGPLALRALAAGALGDARDAGVAAVRGVWERMLVDDQAQVLREDGPSRATRAAFLRLPVPLALTVLSALAAGEGVRDPGVQAFFAWLADQPVAPDLALAARAWLVPSPWEQWRQKARAALLAADAERAARALELALRSQAPRHLALSYGLCLWAAGDVDEAAQALSAFASAHPRHPLAPMAARAASQLSQEEGEAPFLAAGPHRLPLLSDPVSQALQAVRDVGARLRALVAWFLLLALAPEHVGDPRLPGAADAWRTSLVALATLGPGGWASATPALVSRQALELLTSAGGEWTQRWWQGLPAPRKEDADAGWPALLAAFRHSPEGRVYARDPAAEYLVLSYLPYHLGLAHPGEVAEADEVLAYAPAYACERLFGVTRPGSPAEETRRLVALGQRWLRFWARREGRILPAPQHLEEVMAQTRRVLEAASQVHVAVYRGDPGQVRPGPRAWWEVVERHPGTLVLRRLGPDGAQEGQPVTVAVAPAFAEHLAPQDHLDAQVGYLRLGIPRLLAVYGLSTPFVRRRPWGPGEQGREGMV